jgi:urease accessory protein
MDLPSSAGNKGWNAKAWLRLTGNAGGHQAGATAPLKWLRGYQRSDGMLELPLLHTAGGLVGGDQLNVEVAVSDQRRALLTTVAAQKVYGSRDRFRQGEAARWSRQHTHVNLSDTACLAWLPQELVLYADGLHEQQLSVELDAGCSWLGAEVVRLGRSAAGEGLGAGCWRSSLTIRRRLADGGSRWELVDRLSLEGDALRREHGMAAEPVLGTWIWAAPCSLSGPLLDALVLQGRQQRQGLPGTMAIGRLPQGVIARYRGSSTQAARFWFTRLWALSRRVQGLEAPELPRVWPFQEQPLAPIPVQDEPCSDPATGTVTSCT